MSGSQFPPAGRSTGDISHAAFLGAPSPTQAGSRPPNHPVTRHDLRRPATHAPSLVSHLELGPLDSSVTNARLHARAVMKEWRFDDEDFTEAAALLVTEIVANAVFASQALKLPIPSPIHLWLKAGFERVLITVWDGNPNPPVLQKDIPIDAEHGRGLFLVDYLGEQWGWFEPQRIGGKCVWCEVTRQSAARTEP